MRMTSSLAPLFAAGALAGLLARRLCGDPLPAAVAALAYSLSPAVLTVAGVDARWAAWTAGLPLLLLLFYRANDSEQPPWRAALPPAACLALLGALDPRGAIAGGTLVWLLVLVGYAMDSRKSPQVWGPAFGRWMIACAEGAALYAPLWWRRARDGGPDLAELSYYGSDFGWLWSPSRDYVGLAAAALAVAAVLLSRSYRPQTRLWAWVCGALLWLSLGAEFHVHGRAVWWVPCLDRGFAKLPWLGDVPPRCYGAAGRLSLSLLCAYGLSSLLARLPPRRLRWSRIVSTAAAGTLLAADFLRA